MLRALLLSLLEDAAAMSWQLICLQLEAESYTSLMYSLDFERLCICFTQLLAMCPYVGVSTSDQRHISFDMSSGVLARLLGPEIVRICLIDVSDPCARV